MGMSQTVPKRYDLGDCTVTLVSGGSLKLDGGAMFGLIPKAVWSRVYPADDQNRIQLACNCLLVERPGGSGRRVIIETGHGPKYDEREQRIFAINPQRWLLPALCDLGVDPASVTDVILTHLHFDHAGGLTWQHDGRLVPTFPKARVHVQRQEYDDARANFGIMTATYREESFTPVDETGGWRLLNGEVEIVPGIRAIPTPGHTRGHQCVAVEGRRRTLVFGGDLIPTRQHVGPPYNMGYDLLPLDNRASKGRMLEWLAARQALLALDHEVDTPLVTIRPKDDWFELDAAATDAT